MRQKPRRSALAAAMLSGAALLLPPAQADPPGNTGSWSSAFRDDFNSLDLNAWHNGFPAFDGGYHDSPYRFKGYMPDGDPYAPTLNSGHSVTVSGGNLQIVARQEANKGGGAWTTGYVNSATRKTFQYGYLEIRGKFQSTSGNDPGFWLFPNRNAWPPEIDILEVPGRSSGYEAQFNVHWADANGHDVSLPASVGTDPNSYHTYACLWDPNVVVFYMDGQEVHRVVGHSPTESLMMNIADEINGGPGDGFYADPSAGTYPVTQNIDYVRVWTHDGGASVPQVYESETTRSGGTVKVSGENPYNAGEQRASLFDGSASSKWLTFGVPPGQPCWFEFDYPGGVTHTVSRLALTSSLGSHERDPKDITIYGVNPDGSWAKLASWTGLSFGDAQRKPLDFFNVTPYAGYAVSVDAVENASSANSCQVAEAELIEMGQAAPSSTGYYTITSKNSGRVLDDLGYDRSSDGHYAPVGQWDSAGGDNQKWQILPVGDGYYEILNKYSGQCLDCAGQGTGNGTPIGQWTYWGGDCQKWRILPVGSGVYQIVGKQSGRCIDVQSLSANNFAQDNGAALQLYDYLGGANQQWTITAAP